MFVRARLAAARVRLEASCITAGGADLELRDGPVPFKVSKNFVC